MVILSSEKIEEIQAITMLLHSKEELNCTRIIYNYHNLKDWYDLLFESSIRILVDNILVYDQINTVLIKVIKDDLYKGGTY